MENERLLVEPSEFFPHFPGLDIAGDDWYLRPPFMDESSGRMVLTIQAFLIRTPGRVILIDACVGNDKSRRRPEFDHQDRDWLERLRRTGVDPGDIDTVVLTHLHTDHVGWATRLVDDDWVPTFRNARYLVTEAEYRHWSSDAGRAAMERTGDYMADSVEPLAEAGILELIEPETVVERGIELRPAPGETPGHVCVALASEGARAMLSVDTFHHPVQCTLPDWSTRYSTDPVQAVTTRRVLLESVADTDIAVIPTHFPPPTVGHIIRDQGAYRFVYDRG